MSALLNLNFHDREISDVQKVRADFYTLIRDRTRDPDVLQLVRDIGKGWLTHVANGECRGFTGDLDAPGAVGIAAKAFIKAWVAEAAEEFDHLVGHDLNWFARLAARVVLWKRIRAFNRLRVIVKEL